MFTGLEGVKQYYSESVSEDKVADKVEEKVADKARGSSIQGFCSSAEDGSRFFG